MAVRAARSRCGTVSGRCCTDTSMACRTSSTRSARERLGRCLGMATSYLHSQTLERAQLQLLDRALRLAQLLRDLANAPLLHESLMNDAALNFRKLSHGPEQLRAIFDGPKFRSLKDGIAPNFCWI